jgi:hypothetical protein
VSRQDPGAGEVNVNAKTVHTRRRRQALRDGTWLPRVPIETIRVHVKTLTGAGMTEAGIARLANLPADAVWKIWHPKRKFCDGPVGQAILAVTPTPVLKGGHVPAVGTVRRIRAMVADGHPLAAQARHLNKPVQYLWELAWEKPDLVTERTAETIRDLYDRLSLTPGPSVQARNRARRHGWYPPEVWDDATIDDPAAEPNLGGPDADLVDEVAVHRVLNGEPLTLNTAERHHAIAVGLARDMSPNAISAALRMSGARVRELAAQLQAA